jgi:hypothetical protein
MARKRRKSSRSHKTSKHGIKVKKVWTLTVRDEDSGAHVLVQPFKNKHDAQKKMRRLQKTHGKTAGYQIGQGFVNADTAKNYGA